ncbi:MAG TPA: radical SAM protein [Candidatus Omnitrophica bacterium]|nr:radical SAM protein [Candidatus Omnitrophota bacterium]
MSIILSAMPYKNRYYILRLMGACNNNCKICMVSQEIKKSSHMPLSLMLNKIKLQKKGTTIDFFGGEPTLHPFFMKALEFTRERGFSATIATNGRMFFYDDYVKKIARLGVESIRVSLYGNTAKIHDYITNSEGSFDQTIMGLRNIVRNKIAVRVNIVVTKLNYKHLKEIVVLLRSIGVRMIKFSNLSISGNLLKNKALIPDLEKVKPCLESAVRYSRKKKMSVYIEKTPLCLLPELHKKIFIWEPDAGEDKRAKLKECRDCFCKNNCSWRPTGYPYKTYWVSPIGKFNKGFPVLQN